MFTYWASRLGVRQLISAWMWYSLQFKVSKRCTMWLSTSCLLCKFLLCLPCKQCCTSIILQNWYFNILYFQHHCNDEPDFYLQCNEQVLISLNYFQGSAVMFFFVTLLFAEEVKNKQTSKQKLSKQTKTLQLQQLIKSDLIAQYK